MFALVLTATPRAMTMPRGTATLIGRIDTDWAAMSAAGVIGALPIVIFAIIVSLGISMPIGIPLPPAVLFINGAMLTFAAILYIALRRKVIPARYIHTVTAVT